MIISFFSMIIGDYCEERRCHEGAQALLSGRERTRRRALDEQDKHVGRVLASMVALVVTIGISLGLAGQASAAPQSPAANPDQAKVAELQEQYKAEASPEDYQRAVDAYDQLVAGKATDVAAAEQPQGAAASGEEYAMCVSIPKWAVVAVAWYAMVGGGATAVVGTVADATIVGLPAGTVLAAIGAGEGITANALLYWSDRTDWPKDACI